MSGTSWYFTTVYCLKVSAGVVYVGGDFTGVQGEARSCLAALDAHRVQVLELDPMPDGPVRAITLEGARAVVWHA